jgi:hypothetical protein
MKTKLFFAIIILVTLGLSNPVLSQTKNNSSINSLEVISISNQSEEFEIVYAQSGKKENPQLTVQKFKTPYKLEIGGERFVALVKFSEPSKMKANLIIKNNVCVSGSAEIFVISMDGKDCSFKSLK